MRIGKQLKCLSLTLGLLALAIPFQTAKADTLTFTGLSGANGAPFNTYSQGTFTVQALTSNWEDGQMYGDPTPSIFDGPVGDPGNASLLVVDGGNGFTFNSVDYSSNNGPGFYEFIGELNGAVEFDLSGNLAQTTTGLSGGFSTITSASSAPINALYILIAPNGQATSSINIDNINVSSIATTPEPASLMLLSTGLLGLGFVRRKLAL